MTALYITIYTIMAKAPKKYTEAKKLIPAGKQFTVEEAVDLAKKVSYAKFGGSIEIAIKTVANPKYNDQMLRGTTVLPHGTGKKQRIAVFVSEDKVDEVKKLGADIVGNATLVNDIKAGKIDFDVLVTTPEMIRDLAPVAKQLGPKGLMPSPKAGTVSQNLAQTIDELQKGRIEFKLDKTGNVHGIIGKVSFDSAKLVDNINAFIKAVEDHKPTGVKGKLIQKIVIAPTMGPGVQILA